MDGDTGEGRRREQVDDLKVQRRRHGVAKKESLDRAKRRRKLTKSKNQPGGRTLNNCNNNNVNTLYALVFT